MSGDTSGGTIFISHASRDKDVVAQAIARIPKSHIFYDIETLNPGDHTPEALDDALLTADVVALFVSPNTAKSVWVEYEASLTLMQKVRRKILKIVLVPIKGAT
jgi:hypothetical protein